MILLLKEHKLIIIRLQYFAEVFQGHSWIFPINIHIFRAEIGSLPQIILITLITLNHDFFGCLPPEKSALDLQIFSYEVCLGNRKITFEFLFENSLTNFKRSYRPNESI